MKIDIRPVHLELTDEVRDYAAEKIGKLDKYYKNIISAEVKLEEHPGVKSDQSRYTCTVILAIPGNDLNVEERGRDLHEVIDLAEQDLQRQIKKVKDKKGTKKFAKAKELVQRFFGKEE